MPRIFDNIDQSILQALQKLFNPPLMPISVSDILTFEDGGELQNTLKIGNVEMVNAADFL